MSLRRTPSAERAAAGGEGSVLVAASPDRLWALITDITRTGEWSPENIGGYGWAEQSDQP